MFKKLVSNLPFDPSLIKQVSFYTKRLHQEESVRRIGFGFMAGAFLINILAVTSPAERTLASSANDIVYGATSKAVVEQAVRTGRDSAGRRDIAQIYSYFGITADDISRSCNVNLFPSNDLQTYNTTSVSTSCSNPSIGAFKGSLVTTGRFQTAQAGNPHYNNIKSERDRAWLDRPLSIPGTGTTIYGRPIQVWGEWYSRDQVISGIATGEGMLKGKRFWILLKGCGNITFETFDLQPQLEIVKEKVGTASTLHPGDIVAYNIRYRNIGTGGASNVVIEDTLAPEFEFLDASGQNLSFSQSGQYLRWTRSILPVMDWQTINIRVRLKTIPEASKKVCNASSISAAGYPSKTTQNPDTQRCVTIVYTCPGTNLPVPNGDLTKCTYTCPDGTQIPYTQDRSTCAQPIVECEELTIAEGSAWNRRNINVRVKSIATGKLNSLKLLVNGSVVKDFGSIDQSRTLEASDVEVPSGDFTATVKATPSANTKYEDSISCTAEDTSVEPFTRIINQKLVSNITTDTEDASTTTAKAGDVLEYTILVTNEGNTSQNDYVIAADNLGDLLEYADITNYNNATYDDIARTVQWPQTTIAAGETLTRTFQVKLKDPIPTTAASLSDPLSYDYRICNTYGNTICVDVDKPFISKTQGPVETIPNTGPGSSLIISFVLVSMIGFFFMRSRLLAKEMEIIKYEYTAGAIQQ